MNIDYSVDWYVDIIFGAEVGRGNYVSVKSDFGGEFGSCDGKSAWL